MWRVVRRDWGVSDLMCPVVVADGFASYLQCISVCQSLRADFPASSLWVESYGQA